MKHIDTPVKTYNNNSEEDQEDGLMDTTFNKMLRNCGMNQGRIELISHIFFNRNPYDLRALYDVLTIAEVSTASKNLIIHYWAIIVQQEIPRELMTDYDKWRRNRLIEIERERENSECEAHEKSFEEIDNPHDLFVYFMKRRIQFQMQMYLLQTMQNMINNNY